MILFYIPLILLFFIRTIGGLFYGLTGILIFLVLAVFLVKSIKYFYKTRQIISQEKTHLSIVMVILLIPPLLGYVLLEFRFLTSLLPYLDKQRETMTQNKLIVQELNDFPSECTVAPGGIFLGGNPDNDSVVVNQAQYAVIKSHPKCVDKVLADINFSKESLILTSVFFGACDIVDYQVFLNEKNRIVKAIVYTYKGTGSCTLEGKSKQWVLLAPRIPDGYKVEFERKRLVRLW